MSCGPSSGIINSKVTPCAAFLRLERTEMLDPDSLRCMHYRNSPEMMICDLLDVRWSVDVINFQVVVEILAPDCCLQIEQPAAVERNRHVWHHRNEVVRI